MLSEPFDTIFIGPLLMWLSFYHRIGVSRYGGIRVSRLCGVKLSGFQGLAYQLIGPLRKLDVRAWGQCSKTFNGRNLLIFAIS